MSSRKYDNDYNQNMNRRTDSFNRGYQEQKRIHRDYMENGAPNPVYREQDELVKRKMKKKKNNKKIIITSVVCLFLVLGGAFCTFRVFEYEKQKQFEEEKKEAQTAAIEDSQKALLNYYKCIQAKDYSRLYGGVDKNTKSKRAEENFIFVNKAFYNKINMEEISINIKSCTLDSQEGKESDSNNTQASTVVD